MLRRLRQLPEHSSPKLPPNDLTEDKVKPNPSKIKNGYYLMSIISLTWIFTLFILYDGPAITIRNSEGDVNVPVQHHPTNDVQMKLTSPTTNATIHVLFSTDCSPFQHWQSYLFFYSASRAKQPGYVTRIASGCNESQQMEEERWHETHIRQAMSDRFRIHFTPSYSGAKDYKFFNKPFGLKHFLEHSDFMGLTESGDVKDPSSIIILCDPDFLILRPITDDFTNERETIINPKRKRAFIGNNAPLIAKHGNMVSQTWEGLGSKWRTFNLNKIVGADSPAKLVDQTDAQLFYPAGPPYIGTARDMYRIAVKWTDFAIPVYEEYPKIHAEMCKCIRPLQVNTCS